MSIEEIEETEWQKLCERVSKESDPHRLSQLLDQLLEKLDARRKALHASGQKSLRASGEGDK